jgi:hypothetical protein
MSVHSFRFPGDVIGVGGTETEIGAVEVEKLTSGFNGMDVVEINGGRLVMLVVIKLF